MLLSNWVIAGEKAGSNIYVVYAVDIAGNEKIYVFDFRQSEYTIEVKDVKNKEGYIYKPACGRVGEKISIKDGCFEGEYEEILKDVKKHPKEYLAQKKFISRPVIDENGNEFHVCLGSYTVDGKHGGYYARISNMPRIDSNAADIPVLIEGSV